MDRKNQKKVKLSFIVFGIYGLLHTGIVAAQQTIVLPGTKTPYSPQQKKYTAPPAGYWPVFVNYVGRHGSRFLTKEGADREALVLLSAADSTGALTVTGKKILQMTARLYMLQKGNYENISLSGKEEQKEIGDRMRKEYSAVFNGRSIFVLFTKKIRTQQSAEAFLGAFKDYPGKIQYSTEKNKQDDILRFYDVSPAYIAYKQSKLLQSRLDSLENSNKTTTVVFNVCSRIFTPRFCKKFIKEGVPVITGEGIKNVTATGFVNSLYDLYGASFSVPGEMQCKGYAKDSIDFGIAFGKTDLQWLAFKDGAADFFEKGPASDANGIQVNIAVPLLIDFIKTTDSAIDIPDKMAASLRFTHAEAISPFATLLDVSGASVSSPSVFSYADQWKPESVIPMSANIQWILYHNGKEYIAKVLLNEKEVKLPLATPYFPYYPWADVRNYYLNKLKQFNTGIDKDQHDYLLNSR